jgi:hypothetical protein
MRFFLFVLFALFPGLFLVIDSEGDTRSSENEILSIEVGLRQVKPLPADPAAEHLNSASSILMAEQYSLDTGQLVALYQEIPVPAGGISLEGGQAQRQPAAAQGQQELGLQARVPAFKRQGQRQLGSALDFAEGA